MSTEYTNASRPVEDVFGTLISARHPELESAKWHVVFQDKTMKQNRKEAVGKVVIVNGLTKHLAKGLDFVFLISQEAYSQLDTETKEAFIDFLLCQIETLDDGEGYRIRPLDFAGMVENVQRYGAWSWDLKRARHQLVEQLELPFDDGKKRTQEEMIADMKARDAAEFDAVEAEQIEDAETAAAAA